MLGLGCDAAQLSHMPSTPPQAGIRESGPVRLAEDSSNFGTVWSSSDFRWDLVLINQSPDPIGLQTFSTSCGCTVVSSGSEPILLAPNEPKKIPLTIDLRGKPAAPGETRPFHVGISALTIDGHEMRWEVSGMVRDAFWMAVPESISLSTVAGDETPATRNISFRNDTAVIDIRVESDLAELKTSLIAESPSGVFSVKISAMSTNTVSSQVGHLILSGTHTDGNQISTEWPVKVVSQADLFLEPPITHLGAIRAGKETRSHFTVASRTGRRFGVLGINVDHAQNVDVQVEAGDNEFSLVVVPQKQGPCSFDVVISEVRDLNAKTVTESTVIRFTAEVFDGP